MEEEAMRSRRRCIREESFRYACQPIFNAAAGRYTAAELLPRMEEAPPGPEQSGMAGALDVQVLRHALGLLGRLTLPPGFEYLSVNISPLTLECPRWVGEVLWLLQENSKLCSLLCIELTETALDADLEKVAAALELISALGVRLAIDDFGSGQSTILRRLEVPFDVVKLDKQLTDRVENPRADPVFRELLGALPRMPREIVAEGVETGVQYELLKGYGCQWFQGFYFSPPIPEEALEQVLVGGKGVVWA